MSIQCWKWRQIVEKYLRIPPEARFLHITRIHR